MRKNIKIYDRLISRKTLTSFFSGAAGMITINQFSQPMLDENRKLLRKIEVQEDYDKFNENNKKVYEECYNMISKNVEYNNNKIPWILKGIIKFTIQSPLPLPSPCPNS